MTGERKLPRREWVLRAAFGVTVVGSVLVVGCATPAQSGQNAVNAATAEATLLNFEYYRDNVEPIFMRPRPGFVAGEAPCVSCHTFQATTPLKLETLQEDGGRVFWTEEQSRRNYQVVSRLITPRDPENSRLLRKPLAASAGGVGNNHTGGTYWATREDPEWQVIAEWVRNASAAATPQPPPPELDFAFYRACVQPIFVNPRPNAVACTSCHAGGGARAFARPIPEGRANWTEEESRQSYDALMNLIEPGHPEYSRFLHHPLDVRAGGDFMHNGGRRWQSREDPEWQALAAWIRGESRGTSCPSALQF